MKNLMTTFYRIFYAGLIIFQITNSALGQNISDTAANSEIVIRAYPQRSFFRQPGSVSTLNEAQLKQQPGYSLVPALNSLSGVRMEERSPGSYRLSIRGSLLRSPFGIRNIKIYVDEFSLTDAGGNTYLNSLDPGNIKNIEVLKGPEGSLFGANTGGVVLLNTAPGKADSSSISGGVSTGSYGLFQEKFGWKQRIKKYQFSFYQSYQSSDGYRENSAMQRKYSSLTQKLDYKPNMQLRSFIMYSDLHYQTPGGLTLQEFQSDPRQARPKTKFPGAVTQQAAVFNKTFFGGILHEAKLGNSLRHVLALSGIHTDFKNPFITNYEVRNENSFSLRTYLELSSKEQQLIKWKWNLGLEYQKGYATISDYGNRAGIKDTVQKSDKFKTTQYFYFTRLSADIHERMIVEASLSLNYYQYKFLNLFPLNENSFSLKTFTPQLMPKFSSSFKITEQLLWRASVSRGYSPPTTAEVRPSDNNIYTSLQPESGWNYESGVRVKNKNNRLNADITVFYYHLQHAIVRRVNSAGADYFVNADGTKQTGCETQLKALIIQPRDTGLFRNISWRSSMTLYHFTFSNYQNGTADYSGNKLTGVPQLTIVSSLNIDLGSHLYLFVQHNYTDRIPLNDANSVYASSYHLLQAKAGWRFKIKTDAELYFGADNILNKKYSLGNDLNASGGRYYNAAPLRNFFAGLNVSF
jgi:iron complex outermembrane recepter protein